MFEVRSNNTEKIKMQCKRNGSMFKSLKQCFAWNPRFSFFDEVVLRMFSCKRSLVCKNST